MLTQSAIILDAEIWLSFADMEKNHNRLLLRKSKTSNGHKRWRGVESRKCEGMPCISANPSTPSITLLWKKAQAPSRNLQDPACMSLLISHHLLLCITQHPGTGTCFIYSKELLVFHLLPSHGNFFFCEHSQFPSGVQILLTYVPGLLQIRKALQLLNKEWTREEQDWN